MLGAVANKLGTEVKDEVVRNALLESFAVHLRSLMDFLWPEKPRDDDVIVEDFFLDPGVWRKVKPAISDELQVARVRVNKEVAHLTYARLRVSPEDKKWAFVSLANEVIGVMQLFRKKAPREVLGPEWGEP